MDSIEDLLGLGPGCLLLKSNLSHFPTGRHLTRCPAPALTLTLLLLLISGMKGLKMIRQCVNYTLLH